MKSKKRGNAIKEAHDIINGERQDQYGNPEDSFNIIAEAWTWYMRNSYQDDNGEDIIISAKDVAMMMALLKLARQLNQHKRDNIVDAIGYLGIMGDMG